jgi:hypothetical protein
VQTGFATGAAAMTMSKDQQLSELRERLAQANREYKKVRNYMYFLVDPKHKEKTERELAGIDRQIVRIQREIEKLENNHA